MTRDEYLQQMEYGNAFDKSIAIGTWRSYRDAPVEGKNVLDIGAHIGTYSVYASLAGARRVYAFEPLPRNYDLLKKNTVDLLNVETFRQAIRSEPGTMWLHSSAHNGRGDNWGHNTVEDHDRRSESLKIKCVTLQDVLDDLEPSIIKTDCEGSEFDFLLNFKFPDYVEWLFGEIHFHRKEWREMWPHIAKGLRRQGFTTYRGKQSIIDGTSKIHGVIGWKR